MPHFVPFVRIRVGYLLFAGSILLLFLLSLPLAAANNHSLVDENTPSTIRASISSTGAQAVNGASTPAISGNGRFIAFISHSTDLVPNDTNYDCWAGRYFSNCTDVFVHDQQTGQTTRVSITSNGTQGNGASSQPAISTDGRYIAFTSTASNLVPNDTNMHEFCGGGGIAPGNCEDIFVHDRQTGETERISIASNGTQANLSSWAPSISADGRYIAFDSNANNLVPNDTNQHPDVFLHDRTTDQTILLSRAANGSVGNSSSIAPTISAEGRYVAFTSWASNLVVNDTNTVCSPADQGTNNCPDIFVYDRQTAQITRVLVALDGTQGNGSSSNTPGQRVAISGDGRYIAFASDASNLVANDTNGVIDVFVHDQQTKQTIRVSVTSNGAQANLSSGAPSISADGRYVAFGSSASNLVAGDTNSKADIFLHNLLTHQTSRISVSSANAQSTDNSGHPAISSDGQFIAFTSWADNLSADDTNKYPDIFVHDKGSAPKIYLPFIDG